MEVTPEFKSDLGLGIKAFGDILSLEDFELVKSCTSCLHYAQNESIIRQGGFVSQVFFLEEGLVKIVLEGPKNRNTIIKIVEGGNFVALPALGNTEKYPFSVIAITPSFICLVNKECLTQISERSSSFNKFLLSWYSKDYIYMYEKIATISTRNSYGKVASALLYISSNSFRPNTLKLLSRKDLAELSASSIESLNKILQQLKQDGIVEIEKNEIVIKRKDMLEKLSYVG